MLLAHNTVCVRVCVHACMLVFPCKTWGFENVRKHNYKTYLLKHLLSYTNISTWHRLSNTTSHPTSWRHVLGGQTQRPDVFDAGFSLRGKASAAFTWHMKDLFYTFIFCLLCLFGGPFWYFQSFLIKCNIHNSWGIFSSTQQNTRVHTHAYTSTIEPLILTLTQAQI